MFKLTQTEDHLFIIEKRQSVFGLFGFWYPYSTEKTSSEYDGWKKIHEYELKEKEKRNGVFHLFTW